MRTRTSVGGMLDRSSFFLVPDDMQNVEEREERRWGRGKGEKIARQLVGRRRDFEAGVFLSREGDKGGRRRGGERRNV